MEEELIKVGNCANCRIPIGKCVKNKLSTKFSSLGVPSCDSTIYEVFSQCFKSRQTVENVKNLELCRYCTLNFCKLVRAYQNILRVSNGTGSTFSKIIVQSRGRPGRPPKTSSSHRVVANRSDSNVTAILNVQDKCSNLEDDVEEEEDDAPLGLRYLGLTRKRRTVSAKNNNVDTSNKRPKRGKNNDVDSNFLSPEINFVTDGSSNHNHQGSNDGDCLDSEAVHASEISNHNNDEAAMASEQNGESSPDSTPISCKYCEKIFRHPQRLKQHLKTHHETLKDDDIYLNNKDDHEEDEGEKNDLQRNEKKITTASKPHFVPSMKKKRGRPPKIASLRTTTKSGSTVAAEKSKKTAKIHKTGGQKEDHVCKVCNQKFQYLQLLKRHIKGVHTNDKIEKKKCENCDKTFKSAALLKRHSQVHKKDTVFKCDDCEREFPNLLGLQVHAVAHTRKLFICKGCKRRFKIEKNFIQHQETARCTEKKHPCPVETCGKLFKNKDKVKRHLISMHSEKKPFGCDLCGKGFRSQADLKFHEVNAHICGETKQYVCDQCGKRFKSLETLKSHEMYSHKLEKKHFCLQCNKGFPLLATLKIHEISHSTDRPHMCSYCGRTYKHANDLKSHEVVHYRDEEKPFVCPICGKRYHRKDVLRLHQGREKHFAPDIPVPPTARKLASLNAKPKRTNVNEQKISDEDHAHHIEVEEAEEDFESSGDSNSSISVPPQPSLSTQPSGVTVSVVQNLSTHPSHSSHVVFSQSNELNSAPALQILANPTNQQHHHLVPIMHHSSVSTNNNHQQQQQLSNVPQPSFNVPIAPVNEAISDFYRIMYDLS